MSKHTPGPWYYVKHNWSDTGVYDENDLIAMLKISDEIEEDQQERFEEEQEAHARLIAAAPELLMEYERLLSQLRAASEACFKGQSDVAEDLCHEYAEFKSPAITKAKGESKC